MSALIQQTEEWHEFRSRHIGSSDAPKIMGVSPWGTPYQLWAEKLGLQRQPEKTYAMQRGLTLEDEARECFIADLDMIVLPQVVVHPEYEWMMASLDGMNIECTHIVEIKCAGKEDHELACSGIMPPKYFPQVQHQLAVTGLDMAYYFSYDGDRGVNLEIHRDDEYIKKLIEKEFIFWNQLQNLEAPPLTEKDYTHHTDDVWAAAVGEYLLDNQVLKKAEEKLKRSKEQLISMSAGKNSTGGGVQVTHVVRKGSIDYSAVPELFGLDLEKWRKPPTEYVRITSV